MSKYSEFKNVENKLKKFANEKQKELRKLENELQGLMEEIKIMEGSDEEEKLEKKSFQYAEKLKSFQQKAENAKEEFQNKEVELTEPLVNKIKEAIYKYANDQNYDYILPRFSLTYANELHDITQKIINILNNSALNITN